eukprot:g3309.t1
MRASKRLRGIAAESSGVATLKLRGGAGVYDTEILFNGERRVVLLDTGSPLSWFERRGCDEALQTDGQRDGDGYADGEKCEGEFRYGTLQLGGGGDSTTVRLLRAGGLLVASEQMRDSTGNGDMVGILGLSVRQGAAFVHGGVPHPGDLIVPILGALPSRVVSFSIDRSQAHSADGTTAGPSTAKFGGLHGDEMDYAWTPQLPPSAHDWVVELPVWFAGAGGVSDPQQLRVLVDTGCTYFKLKPALRSCMAEQWGIVVDSGITCPPRPSRCELAACSVRFLVGGATLEVAALDLFLHDEERDRQCNRIQVDDRWSDSFDMVFGMSCLASFKAVAFDYASRRVGFAAADLGDGGRGGGAAAADDADGS